ncbi:DNA-binding transcriptional regulator, MarR family [Arthrobacter alpinus]|uniref:DNA-binding transcriptional regulator, MarR family n=1 Tax=Arthrobacter alpinus TaxID=656366 RepID=A0A1H5FWJ7_9MICC|nr:MarR family transcriptional regulator [Arthrobacter alpinus]SEE07815.1 DNA-binding transcriptional regulator, MarR family [Arthrobacter alpinus]
MTESPTWLDEHQQAVWQDLLTVVIALPSLLDRQLERDAETTNFEYSVLARLSMAPDFTVRLSELAAQCDSSLPRLSKVMVRFEQRGWVTRSPDPGNGRYILAALTETGMQKVVESAPGHVNRVRELVFDPLTLTQQRNLGIALSRIAGTVREQLDNRK